MNWGGKPMTGKERIANILKHQPVDRIGVYEHFWNDTAPGWAKKGWIDEKDDFQTLFDFDIIECWANTTVADLDFQPVTLEETEETILTLDGNGARLRRHKLHDSTPEHVGFTVTDREGWERLIKPKLIPEERRINFDAYRRTKERAARDEKFFVWSGVNSFECIHPVCGHENMLVGMALDPEWVLDMTMTYAKLQVALMEILFAKEGLPDGIWFYEDMGFKGRPFMSPDMYRELVQPAHQYTFDYAHSLGLPVIVHSCGMIEKLVPGLIQAGMDCLQVIEVKAGMDLLKLHRLYGDKIALCGGIDVRELYSNDVDRVDAELMRKIPEAMKGFGYILHSDHSIPNTVDYPVFRHFLDKGLEIGTYK
jgi:uroporphyrinogen decarboxylase